MHCESCQHTNPRASRYCNQCGSALEELTDPAGIEAPGSGRITEFAVPGSAEGRTVRLGQILYGSEASALAALAAVGALPQHQLRQTFDAPGVGTVVRCFGVLGNNLDFEEATDAGTHIDMLAFAPSDISRFHQVATAIGGRVARVLDRPDNERVHLRLRAGKLKYLPVNRSLVRNVEADLASLGMHLPWSIGGLDVAFGDRCQRVLQGFGFVCYYGHLGRVEPINGASCFRRTRDLVSVPFGVKGFHTWEAPISDEVIDEDVGLLIEANCRA